MLGKRKFIVILVGLLSITLSFILGSKIPAEKYLHSMLFIVSLYVAGNVINKFKK